MTDTATTRTLAIGRAGTRATWTAGVVFVGRRLLGLIGTMLVASLVVFGALHLAPGSPISFLTQGRSVTPEAIAQLEAQYHLDEPFALQYLRWLGGAVTGDLGRSIIFNDPVTALIAQRTPSTVLLLLTATVLVLAIGLADGLFAGLKPGVVSESIVTVATGVMAIPGFVAAVVLMMIFSVQLGWFPTFGAGEPGLDAVHHTLLPATALSLASIAFVARLTQSAIRTELRADHVQTAISRGLAYRFIVRRHVIRNAAMPVLTVAGLTIAGLIAGSVVIEQIFQLGGVGQLLVTSVQKKDFPVVQAICLLYVVAFIVLNTLIDIAYALLDPRVSLGRKGS